MLATANKPQVSNRGDVRNIIGAGEWLTNSDNSIYIGKKFLYEALRLRVYIFRLFVAFSVNYACPISVQEDLGD